MTWTEGSALAAPVHPTRTAASAHATGSDAPSRLGSRNLPISLGQDTSTGRVIRAARFVCRGAGDVAPDPVNVRLLGPAAEVAGSDCIANTVEEPRARVAIRPRLPDNSGVSSRAFSDRGIR